MSSASTSRTIKFISKAGTYTAQIMSPSGDLFQEYVGNKDNVSSVSPDFSALKPILYFVCMSSRMAEGVVTPEKVDFYFNNVKIEFSGDTSTGVFANYFKKVSPSSDQPYYGLQIVKNIAELSGYATATIKAVATVAYAVQSDTIQASYTIPIQQATGSSYRVTIAAGDTKNFVIREKSESVILKALVYLSGTLITSNLAYKWEKMGMNGWEELSTETGQTLTVSADDISTYGEYRVTVSQSGSELGSDIQAVMDTTDPYDILANPDPEDEAITEDESGNGSVTYTPTVVKRGSSVKAMDTLFFFVTMDPSGNYLNSESDRTTAKASHTVTRAQCAQAESDVTVTITSEN